MIIDGKKIRDQILLEVKEEIKSLERKLKLVVIVVGNDPIIENFIFLKKKIANTIGVDFVKIRFSGKENNLEELVKQKIKKLFLNKKDQKIDGIIVQLPLPKKVNIEKILATIPKNLDVDVLSGKEFSKNILPPVTGAVWEILKRNKIELKELNILIVGKGKLVGLPTYAFLKDKCAKISIISSQTINKEELYQQADLIISGIGKPNLIKAKMIKNNVILIDAGTSTQAKKIKGDIDWECAKKARLFSRVPNGVGPITIALIYKNLLELYKNTNKK